MEERGKNKYAQVQVYVSKDEREVEYIPEDGEKMGWGERERERELRQLRSKQAKIHCVQLFTDHINFCYMVCVLFQVFFKVFYTSYSHGA